MIYHTALGKKGHEPSGKIEPVDVFIFEGNIAQVFDVSLGHLPKSYEKTDILYAEIPWQHGYKKFAERAGVDSKYWDFIKGLKKIIENANGKPIIIIGGKSLSKNLPTYQSAFETKLMHGSYAIAYCYNISPQVFNRVDDLVKYLSERFNCIGNFCCGYGYTGNIFYRAGKKFVMSDINSRCIGFIKKLYENL